MLGAIIGDIIGSRFEFNNIRTKTFDLFGPGCGFTDDTICTCAVADAALHATPYRDALLSWCHRYPNPIGAYGGSFARWLRSPNPQPYGSFGNGSAMRVSAVGWLFNTFDETCQVTVPQAFVCFLEGTSFEDTLRNAISIGGDSDTIGAIAGALAEAHYGIPESIAQQGLSYLDRPMLDILSQFRHRLAAPPLD